VWLLLAASGITAAAQAQSGSVAGSYRAAPQRIDVQVMTWGEDCGARPTSQVIEERGNVSVKEEGAHLTLRFSDRTLKTNACWSPNPATRLVSATSANGRYRAECKTPDGDAKREIGRYTASAAAGKIELLEESDYNWQLKSSHCVAKLRMTQTLTSTRLPVEPPDASTPVQPTAPVAAPTPAATPACVPGPAARLRLRPNDARIAPGERVCFTPRAVDAAGCNVELSDEAVSFTLVRPSGVQGTLTGGCFRAAANTALAEGVFKVVVNAVGLRAEASVRVSVPDLSDITARRGPNSSGAIGSAGSADETALESGVRAVASGSHGMLWLGLTIAGLASLLSIAAIAALRIARRQASTAAPTPRRSKAELEARASARQQEQGQDSLAPSPRAKPSQRPAPVATGPQRICPRCRLGYPPGTDRCASDGEALLDYEVFAKQGATEARHCPECGERLLADSVFCGRCGHRLGG
jgi:ribosomal protein S27AE